jgi:hypothetical protein
MSAKICEEHVSGGGLPCAWVGCPNGTADDTVVLSSQIGDSKPLKWSRGFLDSADGRRRYFWHNEQNGWWDVITQLRNHELARIQRPLHICEYVYHYTTLSALKSIVESQEFWLTDYAYLNDSTEVRHGVDLARDEFDAGLAGATSETAAVFRTLLTVPTEQKPRICVACFSFERDSLTQWKGYGREHAGVAIGIEPFPFFKGLAYPRELSWAPVIYDQQTKRQLLRGFAHDLSALRDRDLKAGSVQVDAYESISRDRFFELLSMMKHEAFRDERELRFVYQEDPESPISRFDGRAPKRFRVAGGLLVPYTTTKDIGQRSSVFDATENKLVLHEIVVGPHPHAELIQSGVREFLAANGLEGVEVNMSNVPFR